MQSPGFRLPICVSLIVFCLSACGPTTKDSRSFPTYDPFAPVSRTKNANNPSQADTPLPPSPTHAPTPTRAPFSIALPRPRDANMPIVSPTPDQPRILPTPRESIDQYVVQDGDSLGSIAQKYGVTIEALMQANELSDPNLLSVGATLKIPAPEPGAVTGPSFKIIPDSELVYGPASAQFDVEAFIQGRDGYLTSYTQKVNDETLTGAQIVSLISLNYSVNPRLLLALIEYRSGWVNNPTPAEVDYPLGLRDLNYSGLYRQLAWAANTLNRGYYLWRVNAVGTWVLGDGTVVPIDPTINAGTAGVQYFLAQFNDYPTWESEVNAFGLFQAYFFLFGNPFDLGIEPLQPFNLTQPAMQLPFAAGEIWSFTGGPHGGWDAGSAWAALDFAPPGEGGGCDPSPNWVTAVADGLILRAKDGAVIQDLDNDGYEQTGWVVLYMHIASNERVEPGTYVYAGDTIGHPSCEGGVSNATHVHVARRYNGEWIPADGDLPFVLSGWVSSGNGIEYDGWLTRGATIIEAWDGRNEINQISR